MGRTVYNLLVVGLLASCIAAEQSWTIPSRLWYTQPATDWAAEALPIGNGRLGAMIFGGIPTEVLALNEDSIWSGGFVDRVNPAANETLVTVRDYLDADDPVSAGQAALRGLTGIPIDPQAYQPLGNLTISFTHGSNTTGYQRWLDTADGTAGVAYEVGSTSYQRQYVASYPAGVLAFRLSTNVTGALDFDIGPIMVDSTGEYGSFMARIDGADTVVLDGEVGGANGIGFTAAAKVIITGGTISSGNQTLRVREADEAVILFAAATTYRYSDPAVQTSKVLLAAASQGFGSIEEESISDYKALHSRVSLDLGATESALKQLPTDLRKRAFADAVSAAGNSTAASDPELISLFFQFGRFLLIASSREGSLPANLQGVWNKDYEPAWGSRFTVNINLEMNYWLAETTNIGETHIPLLDFLATTVRPRGRVVATEMYNISEGWACHHNTDLWGDCAPVDNGTAYAIWPLSPAWLSQHLMEHYRFSGDTKFLTETALPTMHEAAQFYFEFLVPRNKSWVSMPSTSPENVYILPDGSQESITVSPTMDIALLWNLFNDFIEANGVLGQSKDVDKAEFYRSKLLPYQIGKYGQLQEWYKDYNETDPGHRHFSPLFGVFPGHQLAPSGGSARTELTTAAAKLLQRRMDNGGGSTGWSRAWAVALYARLFDATQAWWNVEQLISQFMGANLFDLYAPGSDTFQIDANFGGPAAIVETLLQSHNNGTVHLLPAVSTKYGTGAVHGLMARGGFEVGIHWDGGRLVNATVLSKLGNELRVMVGNSERFMLDGEVLGGLQTTVVGKEYVVTLVETS